MNTDTPRGRHTEAGNAVALTLLGLAVAILAGVAVLYVIGKSSHQPIYTPEIADEEVIEEEEKNSREGWGTYVNDTYEFSFEYPSGWMVATGTLSTGEPVVSVFPAVATSTTSNVVSLEEITSHVSVYPHGAETEETFGKMQASTVIIQIPEASAKDYVFNTGRPWATKAVFDNSPSSWTDAGFVFARALVEEEEFLFMRGEVEISQDEFDEVSGDVMLRSGFIDANVRHIEEEILRSFTFIDTSASSTQESFANEEEIVVLSPEHGEIISSPFSVRGQLPSSIEGDVSLRLEAMGGEVLAEVPIVPQGTWGTGEHTPFEVSLVFDAKTATSGVLVFEYTGFPLVGEKGNKTVPVVFDTE
ncbi:TPA: hypothetical protein DEP58_00720 [Patescibacteria group bacterium]|nr:MAG: hypothetical protein UU98_C0025G0013 [Parcubacteria group bacterium GW2011_GWD2_42_14]HCC04812.1 hypothetical protein [Patescibacteria group bacterium]